jgi:quercetin dioxygenase-like cupin family protein
MGVVVPNASDRASFRRERFNPVVLAQSKNTKVVLACFEPGQFIPNHRPDVDLTLTVLEGEGTALVGAEEVHLKRGSVCFVPAGESRGIFAKTRLLLLHTVTPPPGEKDHEGMAEALAKGVWR